MKYALSVSAKSSAAVSLALASTLISYSPAFAAVGLNTNVYHNCCGSNPDYTFINSNDSLNWSAGYHVTDTSVQDFFGADAAGQALTDTGATTNMRVDSQGYIDVATAGSYTLNISADDFAELFIDGVSVAKAPNYYTSGSRILTLATGFHSFDLNYFGGGSPNGMWFSYTGPGAISFATTGSTVAAVPEPATWAMMLLGFGAIGFAMRRKRAPVPVRA